MPCNTKLRYMNFLKSIFIYHYNCTETKSAKNMRFRIKYSFGLLIRNFHKRKQNSLFENAMD